MPGFRQIIGRWLGKKHIEDGKNEQSENNNSNVSLAPDANNDESSQVNNNKGKAKKPRPPYAKDLSQTDILNELKSEKTYRSLNTAQDFIQNHMYFPFKIGDNFYLIRSDRRIIPFHQAKRLGLRLTHDEIDTYNITSESILKFMDGEHTENIAKLYNQIRDYILRYIFFPDRRWGDYLALWIMGTYEFRIFNYFPYVWLNAEKASGKSLLMKVLSKIAFNGTLVTNPTPAVIFRDVSANSPSLFIDEVEQLRKQDKEAYGAMISLLNSGFERASSVKRCEILRGKTKLNSFLAYSPKMFAGINDIDDVLQDRTAKISLLRKKSDETVERYKENESVNALQNKIRCELYLFALTHAPEINKKYQNLDPEAYGLTHLINRDLDIWEPIFVLAQMIDLASGDTEVTDKMIALSHISTEEKSEMNAEQNETSRVLSTLWKMIDELPAFDTLGKKFIYETEKVFEFFRNTDEFGWLRDNQKGTLTRILRKKALIEKGQKKINGKNTRTYEIDFEVFNDLCQRFKIGG